MTFQHTEKGELVKKAMTVSEVMDRISREAVRFVDLQFTDVPGRLRHVSIPAEMMAEKMFTEGVAKLDGSSVKGFVEIIESDMMLVPDPSTFGVFPWTEEGIKTARLICDVRAGYGGGKFSRDPRMVARRAEETIRQAGFTDSLWGPEVEFFVFDSATSDVNDPFRSSIKNSSKESAN